jgi:aspartyl protease family protein
MRGAFSLALILAAVALLIFTGESDQVLGMQPNQLAGLVGSIAVGVPALAWVISRFQGQWSKALEAIAIWMAIIVVLVGGYAYRFELGEFANRISGALVPGWTIVARGGEVSVVRSGGTFTLDGRVNDAATRFIFDTGATSVVLTRESASRAGINLADLRYTVRVSTANGQTMAAPIVIDALGIGGITVRRVQALVAGEGQLRSNLLGMSFLERLHSWRVEGNRLILRGR